MMEIKTIGKSRLKNIIPDYNNFIDACKEANRYAGSNFIILRIDDEIYNVVE